MYSIGDTVWLARFGRVQNWITCPDCFDTLKVGIELANGEKFSVPCQGCTSGYDAPKGQVLRYTFEAEAKRYTVTGVRTSQGQETEYKLDSSRIGYDSTVFATEALALAQSEKLREEHEAEENKRLMRKEKDHRSWVWHVSYYRSALKRAERDAERFREKLGIAREKAK